MSKRLKSSNNLQKNRPSSRIIKTTMPKTNKTYYGKEAKES